MGDFNKKESESLIFTGLKIPRDYLKYWEEKEMFIRFSEDMQQMHYWGDNIYIIGKNEEYYKLNEVETFLMEYIIKERNIDKLVVLICNENKELIEDVVKTFLSMFIKNYQTFLELDYRKDERDVMVSGKKGENYPYNLIISLTNECLHDCKHCYKGEKGILKRINIEKLEKFLDKMQGKVPYLQLTGGEPLQYSQIAELLEKYSEHYHISISTSGVANSKIEISTLKKIDAFQISLYASNMEKHNEFCANNNSFEKIRSFSEQLKNNNIKFGYSFIVTPGTYDDIENIVKLAILWGATFVKFGTMVAKGKLENNNKYEIPLEKFENVKEKLDSLKEKYKEYIYIETINKHDSQIECGAGKFIWYINEYGNIYPCAMTESKECMIGDITSDNIIKHENVDVYTMCGTKCILM